MRLQTSALALAGVAALGGCVPPPPAQPTVMAFPPQGKSYAAFQQDDGFCRQQAAYQTGGVNPGAAATQNGVASAAVGTGLGAAAGALLGAAVGRPGVGAVLGAGTGLVAGSAVGAQNAQATGMSIQHQYNMVYAQCMIGHGDRVQGPYGREYGAPPPGYGGGYGSPPPPPGYAPPPGYPPPPPGY
jgi:hypothetical protein